MNILITSYYYYPELTPRAFRTYELVKEFARLGHHVTLLLPKKNAFDGVEMEMQDVQIHYFADDTRTAACPAPNQDVAEGKIKKKQNLYNVAKDWIPDSVKNGIKEFREWKARYFYPLHKKEFIQPLAEAIEKSNKNYDLVISIGLPVEIHMGTALGLFRNKKLRKSTVSIADYGDPFSKQNIFWGYRAVDFILLKFFNYVAVPTEKAVDSYTSFKSRDKIKVIPQGFHFDEYNVGPYKKNDVPTFAYAGCFYEDIRNPKAYLDYLCELDEEFLFKLYTIRESWDTEQIIKVFRNRLGKKLKIIYDTPRNELITELSYMDFLINFENTTSNQVPSKLIDYAIADRPICSLSTNKPDINKLHAFMNQKYQNKTDVNLSNFDIKKVAQQFVELRNSV